MASIVGNGIRVRFWLDKWWGDELLKNVCPSLSVLAISKEAWLEEVWSGSSKGGCWTPCSVRYLKDWELVEIERFLLRSNRKKVQSGEDKLMQFRTRDENFSIKRLHNDPEPGRLVDFSSKVIWKFLGPSKKVFFAWEGTRSRI